MISGTRYQLRLETNRQLRLASEIARAQTEISTGKKILSPSDNPAAAARISDISRSQANQATWRGNLDKALAVYAQADGVLKSLGTTFTRAAELMVQGASRTLSSDDRNAIALELASLSQHVATLRGTRDSRGETLFPDTAPIAIPVAPDLELTAVADRTTVFDNVAIPSGSTDLIAILRNASLALSAGNATAIGSMLNEVNAAVNHVASIHAEHGSRGNRIDDMIEQSQATTIVMEDERKGLESADIAEVVARLQSKELSLEAAQATFARINRSNLFDLIG
jgi:flagellar hook-associated protein 3 FlgL